MTPAPFFLAGADRSGIGLVADILDHHPEVAISRRINFWTFYDGRFGPLKEPGNLDRCLDQMWRFRRVLDLGVDRDAVRRRFVEGGDFSYPALFAALGEVHARAGGRTVWGDKSLNAERYADRIFESVPGACMIHVLRDPRDRHVSVMSHRGGKRAGVFGTTAVWVDSERRATENSARYADRYLVLRYEDLVDSPADTLTAVCGLIGVPYDGSLIGDPDSPGAGGVVLHQDSVGRFVDEASRLEIATIQRLTGEGMARRGYRADDRPLSTRDGIVVKTVTQPAGWVLVRAWRPWSRVKSRLSTGPSQRRLTDRSE